MSSSQFVKSPRKKERRKIIHGRKDRAFKDSSWKISVRETKEDTLYTTTSNQKRDFKSWELEYAELNEFDKVMTSSLKSINLHPKLQTSMVTQRGFKYDESFDFDEVTLASPKKLLFSKLIKE